MLQHNGLVLAYIGDAVYELKVRKYLLDNNLSNVNELHHEAIKYTQALSQAKAIDYLLEFLSEEEIDIYKRGRNTNGTHKPKNSNLNDYRKATGLEALIGYLYLDNNESRLKEIIDKSIEYISNIKE